MDEYKEKSMRFKILYFARVFGDNTKEYLFLLSH